MSWNCLVRLERPFSQPDGTEFCLTSRWLLDFTIYLMVAADKEVSHRGGYHSVDTARIRGLSRGSTFLNLFPLLPTACSAMRNLQLWLRNVQTHCCPGVFLNIAPSAVFGFWTEASSSTMQHGLGSENTLIQCHCVSAESKITLHHRAVYL